METKILELEYEIKYKLVVLEDIKNRLVVLLFDKDAELNKDIINKKINEIEKEIKKQRLFENFFDSFKVSIFDLIKIKNIENFPLKIDFNNFIKKNLFLSKFIEIPFFNFTNEEKNIKNLKNFNYILVNKYILESSKIKNINDDIKQLRKIANKVLFHDKNFIKKENTIKNINILVNRLIKNITY